MNHSYVVCSAILAAAAAVAAATIGAGAAQAQTVLTPGQAVQGQLAASDPKLPDNSHYDCFVVETSSGRSVTVEHRSSAFDAFLLAGQGRSCEALSTDYDDDSAGGTDARLVIPGDGGPWFLVVTSLTGGQTGAYTLTASAGAAGAPAAATPAQDDDDAPLTPEEQASVDAALAMLASTARETIGQRRAGIAISAGQTLSGRLSLFSVVFEERFFDCYNFSGRSGAPVTITAESTEVDPVVVLHSGHGCSGDLLDLDDDGGGGTNARLVWQPTSTGPYSYRVTSAFEAQSGQYTTGLSE